MKIYLFVSLIIVGAYELGALGFNIYRFVKHFQNRELIAMYAHLGIALIAEILGAAPELKYHWEKLNKGPRVSAY